MAEVSLSIGGYHYHVACRDGEEAHLERLGRMVDEKAQEARKAVGNASEVRQLLFCALLFADEALEGRTGAAPASATGDPERIARALEALATRVELTAARLENQRQSS